MERKKDYKKIKTYEDACRVLGVEKRDFIGMERDEIAYIKLKTIAKSLNGEWKPDFTNRMQYKYRPWFWLSPRKKSDAMNETDRKRVVFFSESAHGGTPYDFLYAGTFYAESLAYADICSHLCFKNKEISDYVGRNFLEIWRDYILN